MNRDEIEAIAQRPTYCKTDGEAVTLSRAERDALVEMARRYAWLRDADPDAGEPVPMLHECSDWGKWFWLPVQGEALDKRLDALLAKESP